MTTLETVDGGPSGVFLGLRESGHSAQGLGMHGRSGTTDSPTEHDSRVKTLQRGTTVNLRIRGTPYWSMSIGWIFHLGEGPGIYQRIYFGPDSFKCSRHLRLQKKKGTSKNYQTHLETRTHPFAPSHAPVSHDRHIDRVSATPNDLFCILVIHEKQLPFHLYFRENASLSFLQNDPDATANDR